MGFRCSLLGHAFNESDVNRSREVRGDEVVTVVETIERCSNCGAERVVAENKEVVSVLNAADVDLDEDELAAVAEGKPPEATSTGAQQVVDEPPEPPAESTEATDTAAESSEVEAEAETDGDPDTNGADGSAGEEPPEPPRDPDEEDAEFITETDGSLGGGDEVDVDVSAEDVPEGGIGGMAARSGAYGDDADGPSGTPEEPTDPVAPDEDAEILGDPEERPADRAPGQWPDDPDAGAEPWEPEPLGRRDDPDPDPDPEEDSPPAEPAPDVAPTRAETDGPATRLRCPACGHTVEAASSFRAGDACPECRADYLEPASE